MLTKQPWNVCAIIYILRWYLLDVSLIYRLLYAAAQKSVFLPRTKSIATRLLLSNSGISDVSSRPKYQGQSPGSHQQYRGETFTLQVKFETVLFSFQEKAYYCWCLNSPMVSIRYHRLHLTSGNMYLRLTMYPLISLYFANDGLSSETRFWSVWYSFFTESMTPICYCFKIVVIHMVIVLLKWVLMHGIAKPIMDYTNTHFNKSNDIITCIYAYVEREGWRKRDRQMQRKMGANEL